MAPAQNLVPVVRQELMDAAGDTITSTLDPINALLTTEELTNLGAAVIVNGDSYTDAAAQWLADNGF
jgi:glycine betaine/choline ABC-type transport system substrate-binding protein